MGLLENLFGKNTKVEEEKEIYTEEKLDKEMGEYFAKKEAELGITEKNRGVRFEDLGENN